MNSDSDKKTRQEFLKKISGQRADVNKKIEARAAQSLNLSSKNTASPKIEDTFFENNLSMVDVIEASSRALKIITEQKKAVSTNAEKAIDQLRSKIKVLRDDVQRLNIKMENELNISSNLRMELKLVVEENESRATTIALLEKNIDELKLNVDDLNHELTQTRIELESSKTQIENVSDFFKTLNSEIHNKLMLALEEANELILNEENQFDFEDDE